MRLLNFSVGRVHTIQVGRETVRTGHLKAPVAGPWIITEDGAEGDQRAVHPDKLYAFAREAYDYWGDTMNVASRLQAVAPLNGIAVSEATYFQSRAIQAFEERKLVLKGIGETAVYAARLDLGEGGGSWEE